MNRIPALVLTASVLWGLAGGNVSAGAPDACVRLLRTAGSDVLTNGCGDCRSVKVERTRIGQGFPAHRTFSLTGRSRLPLPFRGPGRTRITADDPCPGSTEEARQTDEAARQCVRLAQDRRRGTVLVNACVRCRSVTVERTDPTGEQARGSYLVGPRSVLPVPAGATFARIVRDESCG